MRLLLAIASLLIYSGVSLAWNSTDSVRAVGEGFKAYMDSEQTAHEKQQQELDEAEYQYQIERQRQQAENDRVYNEMLQRAKQKALKAQEMEKEAEQLTLHRIDEIDGAIRALLSGKNLENCVSQKHRNRMSKEYNKYNPNEVMHTILLGPDKKTGYTGCGSAWTIRSLPNGIAGEHLYFNSVYNKGEKIAFFEYKVNWGTKLDSPVVVSQSCYYEHGKVKKDISDSDC